MIVQIGAIAVWQIRLNNCERRLWVGLPAGLKTQFLPDLLWAFMLDFVLWNIQRRVYCNTDVQLYATRDVAHGQQR